MGLVVNLFALITILLNLQFSEAIVYKVGDAGGWNKWGVHYQDWAADKEFHVDDILSESFLSLCLCLFYFNFVCSLCWVMGFVRVVFRYYVIINLGGDYDCCYLGFCYTIMCNVHVIDKIERVVCVLSLLTSGHVVLGSKLCDILSDHFMLCFLISTCEYVNTTQKPFRT